MGSCNWKYGSFGFLVGFLVFVWTPSHFWCLAMKIKDEYAQAEVPMLPVVIGMQKTSKYILGNTIILLPYSLILSFIPDGMGVVYTVNIDYLTKSGGLMLGIISLQINKTPTSEFAWKAYKVTASLSYNYFRCCCIRCCISHSLFSNYLSQNLGKLAS